MELEHECNTVVMHFSNGLISGEFIRTLAALVYEWLFVFLCEARNDVTLLAGLKSSLLVVLEKNDVF